MLTLDDNKCDFQNGVFNLYWGQKILRKKYEGGVTLREFELPYDKKTLKLHLDECNFAGLLEGSQSTYPAPEDQAAFIAKSLDEPIGSPRLEELAAGKRDVVIICSDHTRPIPSKVITPMLLERIRSASPDARIRLLIATGSHRATSREELVSKFGEEIVEREEIIVHDARDKANLVEVGTLPSGGPCIINKIAAEADLLISEGFVEAHFFAGFSGGRKSVLPGVSAYETITANHCGPNLADENTRPGNLEGNVVHRDMVYAARKVNLAFIINVVLNGKREVIGSFAGDLEAAHEAGCEFLRSLAGVKRVNCDVAVVTNGGYPLDQNLYQSTKGLSTADAVLPEGGVVIMVAGCRDGHGGRDFYENVAQAASPAEFLERAVHTPFDKTAPEQWTSQILAKTLVRHPVIYVSDLVDPALMAGLGIRLAKTPDEALEMAFELKGRDARVAVIPNAPGVIVGD